MPRQRPTLRFLKDDDYCLRVKADYVDGFYDTDNGPGDMHWVRQEYGFCVDPARCRDPRMNMAPEFEEGTRAMRYVPEDAVENDRS